MSRTTSMSEVLLALDSFIKREGHACVPLPHLERGLRLGYAVDLLRRRHEENALPAAVAAALQQRAGWFWKRGETVEHVFITAVGEFSVLRGHLGFRPGSELYLAAETYRADLVDGRLAPETFWALQSFPGWRWETGADRGWGDRFREMAAFAAAEGHPRVPDMYKGSPQLGTWVSTQRSTLRAGSLILSRQKRLEMLNGWEWQPAEGMRERYLTELHAYVKANGSADVPSDYVTGDGFALGASLNRIRRLYRRGGLSSRRVADLEAVQGWNWDRGLRQETRKDLFLDVYRAFVEREGHGHVPGTHLEDGFELGRNLVSARHRMKKGSLGQARMDALDAIDPSWRRGQEDSRREKVSTDRGSSSRAA